MRFHLFSFLILPLLASGSLDQQEILDSSIHMPDTFTPLTHARPTVADLLTIESSASIFYSYAREVKLSETFNDINARMTVLVPTNKAVMALARKPHQGSAPVDDTIIISEEEFDAQSKHNVERWVSAHVIAQSPIVLPSDKSVVEYPTMLEGKSVTFTGVADRAEDPEWAHVVIDKKMHIVSMREAENGVLYIVDGTVKFD
ncbi:hypothetical protein C8Q75DRAFT_726577 [Abortiporus biennis]|nr:hypothetical protein C8Q75DRAFT_726577 [Abortiporus biennis]